MKATNKLVSLILVLCLLTGIASVALAEGPSRIFVDSVGRQVAIPETVTKIAISGPLAQIVLFALAPEMLVGVAGPWDASAEAFLPTAYYHLPLLGQLYGGKGEMNLETLLAAAPDVVVDVGEPKASVKEDMDALQAQTGIPFVHITAYLETMGDAYRMLGQLTGKTEAAETLAAYCESVYQRAGDIAGSVEKKNLLYITGAEGLNVIAQGSYHSQIIDLLSNNLAVVDQPSSKGTGNEVDMEQILNWDPDYVIFAPDSIYQTVGEDASWRSVTAISNGNYMEVPMGPYNWMGFPPSVQRLLGMMWMAKALYPEAADYDLYEETARYFQLFYHCELSREAYDKLVENAFIK